MSQETSKYIVRELGRHRAENEIILVVTQRENLSWEEARQLVENVKVERRGSIARRQSPLLIAIGVATFIVGIGLSMAIAWATIDGGIIFFLNLPIPYLGNIVYFVTGLGMMIGSAYGLGPIVLDLLTARDQED
jgi:hypothetical protein